MKKVVKLMLLGMVIAPIAFVSGCAKRCGEPVPHKLEQVKREYGGK